MVCVSAVSMMLLWCGFFSWCWGEGAGAELEREERLHSEVVVAAQLVSAAWRQTRRLRSVSSRYTSRCRATNMHRNQYKYCKLLAHVLMFYWYLCMSTIDDVISEVLRELVLTYQSECLTLIAPLLITLHSHFQDTSLQRKKWQGFFLICCCKEW